MAEQSTRGITGLSSGRALLLIIGALIPSVVATVGLFFYDAQQVRLDKEYINKIGTQKVLSQEIAKLAADMLNHLVDKAKQKGIWSILASISSLNEGSINFHKKNGFIECGRFKNVGRKKGQIFDTVWMQKML